MPCIFSVKSPNHSTELPQHHPIRQIAMRHLLVIALLCCCPTVPAAVFNSSKLGWQAGEDVTAAFEDFIKARHDGGADELVLEHAYRIHGTHQLPDDFILTATNGGGFEVADATEDNNQTFLFLGHRKRHRSRIPQLRF